MQIMSRVAEEVCKGEENCPCPRNEGVHEMQKYSSSHS